MFADAKTLNVFVSVLPQKTFVEAVGGKQVAVQSMVRPGQNPATHDPTPQQIAALARADLYIRVGVPFEQAWMARIQAANPDMPVLDSRAGLSLRGLEKHSHDEHAHEHAQDHEEEQDPHIWTDPRKVIAMTQAMRDQLITLAPDHAEEFRHNYQAFKTRLEGLDCDLRATLADLKQRKFLVYHPAWGYFADAYDLEQVPIEHQGKQPGARGLAALIAQARQERVKTIFVQPQFNIQSAEQVARAIGGRVVAMDPLASDYEANLRRVATLIADQAKTE